MTDWDEAMEEERRMLNGTVAILFSLACMAELACQRSRAVRAFLLWVLRYAEVAALRIVTDAEIPYPALSPLRALALRLAPQLLRGRTPLQGKIRGKIVATKQDRTDPGIAEAMRLAQSFRALARELSCQAAALAVPGADGEQAGIRRRTAFRLRDLAGFPGAAFAFRAFARGMACGAILPDTS